MILMFEKVIVFFFSEIPLSIFHFYEKTERKSTKWEIWKGMLDHMVLDLWKINDGKLHLHIKG